MGLPFKFGACGFVLGVLVALIMAWLSWRFGPFSAALLFVLWPASIFGIAFDPGPNESVFTYVLVGGLVLGGNGLAYGLVASVLGILGTLFRKQEDVSLSLKS